MIKTLLLAALAFVFAIPASSWAANAQGGAAVAQKAQVRITFDGKEAVVTLFDNPQAKEFQAMLPITVTLEDYANAEKIYYLPQKLNTTGGQNAEQVKGDFCYYAPWGNLAIFYKGMGYGTSLYVLGKLDSGKEALGAMGKNFTAKFEMIQ